MTDADVRKDDELHDESIPLEDDDAPEESDEVIEVEDVEEEAKPSSRSSRPEKDDDAERELAIIRPAMFRAHPFRYLIIVLFFLGGLFLGIASPSMEKLWNWLSWPGFIIATIALGVWCQWWFVSHLSRKLTITNKRTIHRLGFFSRSTSEVMHHHIRNIKIDQSLPERIFKTGRLRIDSSAGGDDEGGIEIEMFDVPQPHQLKAMIDEYRPM